jgi:hypothetical protein
MTAAEKALADRDRQWRRYRAAKKAQFEVLYESEPYGGRLRKFGATLHHFQIDHAERMVEFVQRDCRDWLRQAPSLIREAALELISRRCIRILERAGLDPLDDPLPGEEDDVFRVCRKELRL